MTNAMNAELKLSRLERDAARARRGLPDGPGASRRIAEPFSPRSEILDRRCADRRGFRRNAGRRGVFRRRGGGCFDALRQRAGSDRRARVGGHSGLAILAEARRRGIAVPRDLSVVGFDDPPQLAEVDPPLTTIVQPSVEKGRIAARILFEGGPPRQVVLPVTLIVPVRPARRGRNAACLRRPVTVPGAMACQSRPEATDETLSATWSRPAPSSRSTAG